MSYTKIFDDHFNDKTISSYLHYIMKYRHRREELDDKKVLARIQKIQARGIDPFHARGAHGLTPLHVAVLAGNREGICFLLKRNVQIDLQDDNGNTAGDLAHQRRPFLLDISCRIESLVDQLLRDQQGVVLPCAPFTYHAHSNDFGVSIRQLLLPNESLIPHYLTNFRNLAVLFGFQVRMVEDFYFPRDLWFSRPDGSKYTFFNYSVLKHAIYMAGARDRHLKGSSAFLTKHPFFHQISVGAAREDRYRHCALKDLGTICPKQAEQTLCIPLYVEGGDQYRIHNAKGVEKLLLGEDFFSVNYHCVSRCFDRAPHDGVVRGMQQQELDSLTDERAAQLVKEIRVQKLEWVGEDRALAAYYLATKRYVHMRMAATLQIPAKDLIPIPKAAYHLDCFMRPGPKGSVFVQDYGLCSQLLEEMRRRAAPLGLSMRDQKVLLRYHRTAEGLHGDLGPLLRRVRQTLERADFIVIPTPGAFYDLPAPQGERPPQGINFLNAVTGWSDKRRCYFYIASGAKVGDRLGSAMMRAFAQFVCAHQPGLQVHFVGHDPNNPQDFSEAMLWMNDLNCHAGAHCLSFELETEPHTDSS